jgi:hypothetical protein
VKEERKSSERSTEHKRSQLNRRLEYEKVFNEILGTNIKWSKLSLEELAALATLFKNPEILMKRLGVNVDERELRDRIIKRGVKVLKRLGFEGPLVELADELTSEESK